MGAALFLQWHYLIFIVPFGLSAFLLLLSTLRLGGHHSIHGHAAGHTIPHMHAHTGTVTAAGHGAAHPAGVQHSATHAHGAGGNGHNHTRTGVRAESREGTPQTNVLVSLLGLERAPLPMILEAFFLVWGLAGCILNQLAGKGTPTAGQMLWIVLIATGCGLIGARVAAELIGRLMPQDESQVVSRESLFGLKGKVAFPVTETGGRIMVYDDFGSLHDESCRVVTGHPPIARGRKVMVMDRDPQGNLLVEEIPE